MLGGHWHNSRGNPKAKSIISKSFDMNNFVQSLHEVIHIEEEEYRGEKVSLRCVRGRVCVCLVTAFLFLTQGPVLVIHRKVRHHELN